MTLSDKANTMRQEISSVSSYRALIISKYFVIVCLIISSYFVGYFGYMGSPVYILLLYLVLPSILSYTFKDFSKKYNIKFFLNITKNSPFLLNALKRKYHYTKLNYVSNLICYYFTILLIALWQYKLHTSFGINIWVSLQPAIIIAGAVLIRIFGVIFYQIKLPFDLSHNRL